MKKVLSILLVLPLIAGCTKYNTTLRSEDFTHTGCASAAGTRAGSDDSEKSLLILKYEDGNLRVTRTNAMLNCVITIGEIICETSVEGNTIHYKVYEYQEDGLSANCMCRVAEMTSVVKGLVEGKEYTFDYYCSHEYEPLTFVFKKGFVHIEREEDPWPGS
jgi:hypothetical protein